MGHFPWQHLPPHLGNGERPEHPKAQNRPGRNLQGQSKEATRQQGLTPWARWMISMDDRGWHVWINVKVISCYIYPWSFFGMTSMDAPKRGDEFDQFDARNAHVSPRGWSESLKLHALSHQRPEKLLDKCRKNSGWLWFIDYSLMIDWWFIDDLLMIYWFIDDCWLLAVESWKTLEHHSTN